MDWKTAAQILGERLVSSGPTNYYKFTPEQWLAWATLVLKATGPQEKN